MDDAAEPLEYVAAHLAEALACDPRVNELGLQIAVRGTKLYVSGSVQTDERRAAIDEVAAELALGFEVHNQTVVTAFVEPDSVETLS